MNSLTDDDFRYGFQNQEEDDEIKGEGNSVNFEYRMHDPRLGRFFAIDPLTAKYPHYSPYVFSGNMVIHKIELEGLEPAEPKNGITTSTTPGLPTGEISFALANPEAALKIGKDDQSTNISSVASRFARRGISDASTSSILNLNTTLRDGDEGSQINALRHVLWQAMIRQQLGYNVARYAGFAHEDDPNIDLSKRTFGLTEIMQADNTVDLLNNKIGREIGRLYPDATTNELAQKVVEYYYEKGFYTFKKVGDKIKIVRAQITKQQRDDLLKRYKELNNFGETKTEETTRVTAAKKKKAEVNKQAWKDAESGLYD